MKRLTLLLAAFAALPGCATPAAPVPINRPLGAAQAPPVAAPGDSAWNVGEEDVLGLALSGGGARAASFSLGVLEELAAEPAKDGRSLLDHVAIVSAVSGGSITAAYFGVHGAAGLTGLRAAYLDKDAARAWHTSIISPANWVRLSQGGLNNSARLGDWLDREVFAGARMSDLARPGAPLIWINAADLFNGAPFAFTASYFSALCSDLGSVRIADAVAASMSVPVVFRPVVAAAYPDQCAGPLPPWAARAAASRDAPQTLQAAARAFEKYRSPEQMRFVHLVDGGVVDNLGLSSLLTSWRTAPSAIGPLSPGDAVRVRRVTFIVVNAEKTHPDKWPLTAVGPGVGAALAASLDASMDSGKRAAYDLFAERLRRWETDLRAYRCALPASEVQLLRGRSDGWDCTDVHVAIDMISFADLDPPVRDKLGGADTALSLPRDLVDALIAGGRESVRRNAAIAAFAH